MRRPKSSARAARPTGSWLSLDGSEHGGQKDALWIVAAEAFGAHLRFGDSLGFCERLNGDRFTFLGEHTVRRMASVLVACRKCGNAISASKRGSCHVEKSPLGGQIASTLRGRSGEARRNRDRSDEGGP